MKLTGSLALKIRQQLSDIPRLPPEDYSELEKFWVKCMNFVPGMALCYSMSAEELCDKYPAKGYVHKAEWDT